MSKRGCVGALLVLALSPAHADSGAAAAREKVRLVYLRDVTAATCPDADELAAGVTRELGTDPFSNDAARTARVAIVKRGSTFVARIELDDATGARGTRELGAATCAELVPAIVLAIGLAIDPLLLVRPHATPATAPAPAPASAPDPTSPLVHPTIATAVTAPPRPPARLTVLLGAGALVAFDAEPATTAGFFVDLGLARGWWQLLLEWRGDLPATGPVVAGGRVRESLVGALLAPCFKHRWAAVCGLVGIGSEVATGLGYTEARSVTAVWAAAGGRLAVEIPLAAKWRISLRADLLAPLTRMELVVGPDVVWRTHPVTSALGAAAMAQLW